MVRYASQILERYISPGVTDFISADVPDISEEAAAAKYWIAHHFLNSLGRGPFAPPFRQYAANFVRRADAIFTGYVAAREATLTYLSGNDPYNPNATRLYRAITAWESLLLNGQIAVDLVRRMQGYDVFTPDDGSPYDRLRSMANTIKHHAEDIRARTLTDDDILPLWLTSDGISTKRHSLKYSELATFVREIAGVAKKVEDPITFCKVLDEVP